MNEPSSPVAQLPLDLGVNNNATFDNYIAGPNAQAVAYLRRLSGGERQPGVYLWGPTGVGKSHLLQAVCQAAGAAAMYLPLQWADRFPCEALRGIENLDRVCIDDIHAIAGRRDWETALTRLLDRIQAAGGGVVIAGDAAPAALGLASPQLASRLAGGLTLQLQPLDEADKLQALRERAARRGLQLSDEAGRYLARHYSRDMGVLCAALERIDQASLIAKRKPTIPFMRSVLAGTDLKAG